MHALSYQSYHVSFYMRFILPILSTPSCFILHSIPIICFILPILPMLTFYPTNPIMFHFTCDADATFYPTKPISHVPPTISYQSHQPFDVCAHFFIKSRPINHAPIPFQYYIPITHPYHVNFIILMSVPISPIITYALSRPYHVNVVILMSVPIFPIISYVPI